MLTLKISMNIEPAKAMLARQRSQVAYAAARALTSTAKEIQRRIPGALEKELDRPTQFTKSGTFVIPARKSTLEATIGFKDKQAKYMRLQIEGGVRQPGARGIKMPGDVTLDAFGNIPRGTIAKLIAAAMSGKYGSAVKKRLGINARGKAPNDLQLFYGQPRNRPDLPVGIWRRVNGGIVPVIVFRRNTAHYRPRFKFHELAERTVKEVWPRQFAESFDDAMRTAR